MPTSEVDLVWEEVVRALWEGKLGHTAKVSGAGPHSSGSHVICVYVDPFWEVSEVERVLAALRSECGIADSIKFKADGVTMLNLAKDNEFGIPPSFYAASRGSSTLQVQTPYNSKGPKKERGGEWGGGEERRGDGPRSYGGQDGGNRDAGPDKKTVVCKHGMECKLWKTGRCVSIHLDADGFEITGPAKQSRKKGSTEREEPTAAEDDEKDRRKKDKAKKKAEASGGFGALMGIDDGDADAILEKKRRKAEKKAAKKAAEEEQVAEESAASFAALKAKLASGGGGAWGDDDEEEDEEEAAVAASKAARKAAAAAEAAAEEAAEEEAEEEEEEEEEVAVAAAAPAEPAKEKKKKALTDKELEVEAMMAALETNDKDEAKEGGEVRPPPRRLGTRRSLSTLHNPAPLPHLLLHPAPPCTCAAVGGGGQARQEEGCRRDQAAGGGSGGPRGGGGGRVGEHGAKVCRGGCRADEGEAGGCEEEAREQEGRQLGGGGGGGGGQGARGGGAAWSKCPRLQQPVRPTTAPEAHPLAQGCLPGRRGAPSPFGSRREAALWLARRCLPQSRRAPPPLLLIQDGGDKKKKAKGAYHNGPKQTGVKQRGSDAKYQGE